MPARGSKLLLEAWKDGAGIDEDLIRALGEAFNKLRVENLSFTKDSSPTLYMSATADDIDTCPETIRGLLGIPPRPGIKHPVIRLFPRGIPIFTEVVIDYSIGGPGH